MVFESKGKKLLNLVVTTVLLGSIIGCSNQKYSQCQSIIAIANAANNQAQQVTSAASEKVVTLKSWLQAANIMRKAAQRIENLPTKDPQLIQYQENLASVFKIYSQAIYEAVKARENKNLSALKVARENAQKAEKLNQTLVAQINSYCSQK